MVDIVDKKTRSLMMAGIRGKDTKPELVLRRALHARGYRYRLHITEILGKPDLVLRKYSAVVFVHGCFWHRHSGCRYSTLPSTRRDFWQKKFDANVARDKFVSGSLLENGWRVAKVWECGLKSQKLVDISISKLTEWLYSNNPQIEIGSMEFST